jgi:peroxiredoxin
MITFRLYTKILIIYYFSIVSQAIATPLDQSSLIGTIAPPISLQKLGGGGSIHSRDILKNQSMVLVFFSTTNNLSLKMVAAFHQIRAGIKNENIKFFLVNILEDQKFLQSFIVDKVYTIPVIMDKYGTVIKKLKSDTVPLTLVIDSGGEISYYQKGYSDSEIMNLIVHLRSRK